MKCHKPAGVSSVVKLRIYRRSCLLVAAAIAGVAGTARHARAQSLTWDASGTAPVTGSDGAGAWNNGTGLFWANGTSDVAWNNSSPTTAVFGAGGTGAYNVSLGTPIIATGITFNAGPSYTLIGTAANYLNLSGGTVNFSSSANLSSVNLNGSGGLTFNGNAGSTLSLTGAGSSQNFLTGPITINSGNVSFGYTGISGNSSPFNISESYVVTILGGTMTANATELMGTVTMTGGAFNTTNATVVTPYSVFYPAGITTLASPNTATVGVGFNLSSGYISSGVPFNVSLGTTSNGVDLAMTGPMSGTSGQIKIGAGNLVESGINTYTGTTNVSGGTLTVTSTGVLSGSIAPLVVGATLNLGSSTAVGSVAGNSIGIINVAGALNDNQTGSTAYAGTLNTSGGLTVAWGGNANLTLTGTNTIAGVTSVIGGTLNVSTAAYSTASLSMTGGKFVVGTSATPVAGLSVNSLSLNPGSASIVAFVTASHSLALGAITRSLGSTLDITLPTTTGTVTTTTANVGGGAILAPWATVNGGTNWAVSAGSNGSPGTIAAFSPSSSTYSTSYATAIGTSDFNPVASGTFTNSGINSSSSPAVVSSCRRPSVQLMQATSPVELSPVEIRRS
jgi:autotransporter-associated beta strand protein